MYNVRLGKKQDLINNPLTPGEKLVTEIICHVEKRLCNLTHDEVLAIDLPPKSLIGMVVSNLIVNLCAASLSETLTSEIRLQEMQDFMGHMTTLVLDAFQKIETIRAQGGSIN